MLGLVIVTAVIAVVFGLAWIIPGGIGGHVYIASSPIFVTQHTTSWGGRLADVTTSGTPGTAYQGVRQDPTWTADFPMDDAAFPEAIGFQFGNLIAVMYFKHGSSALSDKLVNTTVETVEKIKNAGGDVVRVRVTGRGGFVTPNVTVGS